jgi:virginiamycin B lyase
LNRVRWAGLVFLLSLTVLACEALDLAQRIQPVQPAPLTRCAVAICAYPLPKDFTLYGRGLAVGPDHALWVTDWTASTIRRITLDGQQTHQFPLPTPMSSPWGITRGPDGAMWFTEQDADQIGRITVDGAIVEFPLGGAQPQRDGRQRANGLWPREIVAGRDGALWFTEYKSGLIGRITTGGAITRFPSRVRDPWGIAAGPDGALWYTGWDGIGRITTDGQVTTYPLADTSARGIAAGPDGAMWFTNGRSIGRITMDGTMHHFNIRAPNAYAGQLTTGPDGAIWFTDGNRARNRVWRLTVDGAFTEYRIDYRQVSPEAIVATPDGGLWFTLVGGPDAGVARIESCRGRQRDCRLLVSEPLGTEVMFRAVWGDYAEDQWYREHAAALEKRPSPIPTFPIVTPGRPVPTRPAERPAR